MASKSSDSSSSSSSSSSGSSKSGSSGSSGPSYRVMSQDENLSNLFSSLSSDSPQSSINSSLFSSFTPSSSSSASNYNPYNSQATQSALADQNAAALQAGRGQLDQSKEAAAFGSQLASQAQSNQRANQSTFDALGEQQKFAQKQQEALSPMNNTGYLAFGGSTGAIAAQPKQDMFGRPLGTEQNLQDQMRLQNQQFDQGNYKQSVATQQTLQQQGQQQANDRMMAQIQGKNSIEQAKIAANAQLGSAAIGAQGNVMSSLFGSLGNMVSNVGGGGRHQYW